MPKKKLSPIPRDLTIFYYKIGPPMQSKFHHPQYFPHTSLPSPQINTTKKKTQQNFSQTKPTKIPQSYRNPTKNPALNPYKLYRETPKFPAKNTTKNTQKQYPCKPKQNHKNPCANPYNQPQNLHSQAPLKITQQILQNSHCKYPRKSQENPTVTTAKTQLSNP